MKGYKGRALTKDVHLRMTEEQHGILVAAAEADERDIGSMIRILVNEALNARIEAHNRRAVRMAK